MGAPHNVVRIMGSAPGGEVWSINPRFAEPGGDGVTEYSDLLSWAVAIGALNTNKVWPADLLLLLSSGGAITQVRVEHIGADGVMTQAADFVPAAAIAGTQQANKPLQVAWCASLLTGRPGRSYRGRLYLPAWSNPTLGPDTRVPSATRATVLASFVTWLHAVETAASFAAPVELAVVSVTKGVASPVTQIALGDILDTQRRRRDALIEQRTTNSY